MRVARRTVVLTLIVSAILGAGVSLIVESGHHQASRPLQLTLALGLVILLIAFIGALVHYHYSLEQAKRNLDEAQSLALLGSWERDIPTGRGYWSDNRYRLFGLPPRSKAPDLEEFYQLVHPEDRQRIKNTVSEACRAGTGYEATYRLADDRQHRVFLSRGKVVRDEAGKPATLVGTTQDITEKLQQQRLTEDLLRNKDVFISRLGHDLKTPLTPLTALLPLIRNLSASDRQRELIDICASNVSHITDIVEKTMQLARRFPPSHRPLVWESIVLKGLVDSCIDQMSQVLASQAIEIKNLVDPALIVSADRSELYEVFGNLISNAVKFSPSGSRLNISAAPGEPVTVTVSDNGIGLSEEECSQMFDEFYKADTSRHALGSAGLGLSICRQIVENHGGRIWAVSNGKGLGTSVSFTLAQGGAS